MQGRRGFLIPLSLLILIVVLSRGWAKGSLFTIGLFPKDLFQGKVVKVVISPNIPGVRILSARFLGKTIPLVNERDSAWALIGASLNERPGTHLFTIRWEKDQEKGVFVVPVTVKKKDYPKEYLKVPRRMVEFPPDVLKRVLADQAAIKRILSRTSSRKYFEGPFKKPVPGKIKSVFGVRRYFNGRPRSPHSGVDLAAREGTPVLATNSGRVVLVRRCYLAGNTIVIDHGLGLYSIYAHLEKVLVRPGDRVKEGQTIALSGQSGRATGPHLHWGISIYGTRVDPISILKIFSYKETQRIRAWARHF